MDEPARPVQNAPRIQSPKGERGTVQLHPVKLYPSKAMLPREEQLAWKIAGVAADKVAVQKDVQEMIINRIIDNASVAIASVNEIQVDLVRAICLHEHKVDHIAHLCPSAAAGIGTLLGLKQEVIYQAVQQALHVSVSFRQSRKGEISSWKAFAPAHAGKLAIEAVDRALRGEGAPSPIYEGEDSVIGWVLSGRTVADQKGREAAYEPVFYSVPLPAPGEP